MRDVTSRGARRERAARHSVLEGSVFGRPRDEAFDHRLVQLAKRLRLCYGRHVVHGESETKFLQILKQ